jgi:ribosomal protein S18 acetylase RimI-like enzyme
MARELAWRIEETCFNAFPSLRQVLFGDWLMRFSASGPGGSVSRRANSVNPLRSESSDVASVMAVAEPLYRLHGLPAIFRVPSIAAAAIDDELAARGYSSEAETCVLHGALARLAAAADAEVQLLASPTVEWLAAMAALQGHSSTQADTYRGMVGAIAVPVRFALLTVAGRPAALAYGALHDGLLCYESVVTDPGLRRQGLARRVIGALAAWARASGAEGASLQVQADNTPALTLYAGFGLTAELYRYHYRRQPRG